MALVSNWFLFNTRFRFNRWLLFHSWVFDSYLGFCLVAVALSSRWVFVFLVLGGTN